MASTGFTLAGTGANNTDAGVVAWSNPGNLTVDDGADATSVLAFGQSTQYLHATNFGFALPPGATIDGIEVRIDRARANNSPATCDVRDAELILIKGGTRTGTDKALTAVIWPTTDGTADYGGAADLWGNTLLDTDVEASTFGVALRATTGGTDDDDIAQVDAIWINVHYTAGTASTLTAALGTIVLAGLATPLVANISIAASSGNFNFNGIDAGLSVSTGLNTIVADLGAFTLSGINVNLTSDVLTNSTLAVALGAFELLGQDVSLIPGDNTWAEDAAPGGGWTKESAI